jgi:DNA-binding NarL/FixJ family response regulator
MNRKTRIMMIEDHPEYREVVGLALSKESDMEVTSQFGTSERALRSLRDRDEYQEPDIILLDLHLPGASGLEAVLKLLISRILICTSLVKYWRNSAWPVIQAA